MRNFDEQTWVLKREDLIYKGLYEKFKQNPELANKLLSTGDKLLVEASPYDRIWGIGLSSDEKNAWDTDKWLGTNVLGKVLMRVRSDLK